MEEGGSEWIVGGRVCFEREVEERGKGSCEWRVGRQMSSPFYTLPRSLTVQRNYSYETITLICYWSKFLNWFEESWDVSFSQTDELPEDSLALSNVLKSDFFLPRCRSEMNNSLNQKDGSYEISSWSFEGSVGRQLVAGGDHSLCWILRYSASFGCFEVHSSLEAVNLDRDLCH